MECAQFLTLRNDLNLVVIAKIILFSHVKMILFSYVKMILFSLQTMKIIAKTVKIILFSHVKIIAKMVK